LGTVGLGFFKDQGEAGEPLWLVEDKPDRLSGKIGGTPSPHFSWDQRCSIDVQPAFVRRRSIRRNGHNLGACAYHTSYLRFRSRQSYDSLNDAYRAMTGSNIGKGG